MTFFFFFFLVRIIKLGAIYLCCLCDYIFRDNNREKKKKCREDNTTRFWCGNHLSARDMLNRWPNRQQRFTFRKRRKQKCSIKQRANNANRHFHLNFSFFFFFGHDTSNQTDCIYKWQHLKKKIKHFFCISLKIFTNWIGILKCDASFTWIGSTRIVYDKIKIKNQPQKV